MTQGRAFFQGLAKNRFLGRAKYLVGELGGIVHDLLHDRKRLVSRKRQRSLAQLHIRNGQGEEVGERAGGAADSRSPSIQYPCVCRRNACCRPSRASRDLISRSVSSELADPLRIFRATSAPSL